MYSFGNGIGSITLRTTRFADSSVVLKIIMTFVDTSNFHMTLGISSRAHVEWGVKVALGTLIKAILVHPWTGPEGSRRLRLPDHMTQHMKVISSAPRTGRLYPPGDVSGTHFC